VAEVEVIASTRRRWSEVERRTILAEADQDGITVSAVARRHGLSPSLLFRWRREFKQSKKREAREPAFVPLALPAPSTTAPATASSCSPGDKIEIILDGGRRIIVGKDVDAAALRRIVEVLEGRLVRCNSQSEAG
jgi:transposase